MSKYAVITGAGGGLGFALTERLVGRGYVVLALDYIIPDRLNELQAKNPELLILRSCDVSDQAKVMEMGEFFGTISDHVDYIYNVAGVFKLDEKLNLVDSDLDAAVFARMYNINAVGPMRVVKALWNYITDGTVILNVSSEAGSIGTCWRKQEYNYCMSKAALNMGARILANELEDRNVRVINVHPGWMRTAMGGEEAKKSSNAIEPEQAADDIIVIVDKAFEFPKDVMYMDHDQTPRAW